MDAFSGDSVPVHLITREAFAIYFRHLKPTGILAVNISNTYLALDPVMERAANAFDKVALVYHWTPADDDILCFSCSWALLMDRSTAAAHPELQAEAKVLRQEKPVPHLDGRLLQHVRHSEVRASAAEPGRRAYSTLRDVLAK